jgi:aldoxime dehydratase
MTESAIPLHLQCPRSRPRRVSEGYQPPFPSAVARYDPGVEQVVMAYFGVQYRGDLMPLSVNDALTLLAGSFEKENGARHWERARYVDEAGFTNIMSVAYWDFPTKFDEWFDRHGAAWTKDGAAEGSVGTFAEVLRPVVRRFETLFSSDLPEGVACLAQRLSDAVQEHGYWGGARDRIPLSQTENLAPVGSPRVVTAGILQRVLGQEKLCLIRSGQDWSATEGKERRMYLEDVEPTLRAGMDFLRDDGLPSGCFANRYLTAIDGHGNALEKSFGMSWWRSLADLERWAESHPTHHAIFGAAMKYLGAMGPDAKLRLYHEVTVAAAQEQYFEYANCHPETGMLRALFAPVRSERG